MGSLSEFVSGLLVQVISTSVTFLGFFATLALCASPVPRYGMLRYVLWWLNGVFSGSTPVPADNIFLETAWIRRGVQCGRLCTRAHSRIGYSRDCVSETGMLVHQKRSLLVFKCASGVDATK